MIHNRGEEDGYEGYDPSEVTLVSRLEVFGGGGGGGGVSGIVPFSPIGPGLPLILTIESIFPGSAAWHHRDRIGGVLVASAVKNEYLKGSTPLAMHYYFKDVASGETLIPSPEQGGSNVIYYSPGMVHRSLDVEIRMAFDKFDPAKLAVWTDAVGKVSNLPIFASIPAAKEAAAIVYAASNAIKFASRALDGWFDNEKDWISTWSPLPIAEEGYARAESSWVLFYGDQQPKKVQGPGGSIIAKEFDYRGNQFLVDEYSGTLRYKKEPDREVLEGDPYVLARVSGASEPSLKNWAPSAVSAILHERFYSASNNGGSTDILEVAESLNDIGLARQIAELDEALKKIPAKDRKVSELQKRRDGALNSILDEKLAKLIK
ncbi:hypothetical protein GCM10009712_41470 [Pseudarthrobacter sulfonivorans]|uniref:hypothetical protein n=1 Tax=Pseudarthrobacter sulfonivorans TaxID=121292 RepID=UPI00168B9CC5|nr:hypothetical protein [Pseudarthrobacter sulfonivorans]